MSNKIVIKKKIKPFNKIIKVDGDKSISIRWLLLASQTTGISKAYGILQSEDIFNTIKCLKRLGVKIKIKKSYCELHGVGLNGFKIKKNLKLNAGNSGTLARLILGLLIHSKKKITLTGDNSLSKRDFLRVIKPLKKFGAKFEYEKKGLPLSIIGTDQPRSIRYFENRGSAQCKSSIMLASLNTPGETFIRAKKSRNHTELFCKYLNLPISLKNKNKYDEIKIKKVKKIKPFYYKIPSDISSSAFFIVLTALNNKSKLLIKNVNINPSRIGVITILKKMGVKIRFQNQKIYKGERNADLLVQGSNSLKAINCPSRLNSGAIDEFLVIFLVAAKAKGISYFKDLSELDQKESPRLKMGSKILNMMGIKTKLTKSSIKIYGNPELKINHKIELKNYLKDHRVFMMGMIAALSQGGYWKLHDPDSVKTSFPSFLKLIKKIRKQPK